MYLEEIAAEVCTLGLPFEIALLYGNPAKELIPFVPSHRLDMLVMRSHGHRLLSDIIMGETVDPVRHKLEIPILVVR